MEKINLYSNIKQLIEYIEENIEENLSLELLSEVSSISKYHLTRVFKNMNDHTLMDYVRSRKLTKSIHDLINTDMNILDIAIKYYFNYEQSYIRAFKNEYGLTPAKFRNNPIILNVVDKINIDLNIDFKEGILLKPRTVIRPEIKVIGIKDIIVEKENYTDNLANNRGVDFFFNHSHKIKNPVNSNIYIGLTREVFQNADYTFYMPSLEVKEIIDIPDGMHSDIIPPSKYTVFHYIGNHPPEEISIYTMDKLYHYIFNTWIKQYNYDLKKFGYNFEEIDVNISSNDYCEAKIYFPIELL